MKPVLTHIALGVADIDRTIAFYRKHVGLRVVHERNDGGMRVVWLGEDEPDVDFVLVLLPTGSSSAAGGNLLHLGFAVGSREEVDAAAAAARADGILAAEPVYGGPIVGYFCIVADPDGNQVEFSYGQPINPKELPPDSPGGASVKTGRSVEDPRR
jgi:catechol 2,3-dioxygenase-like lactoylglutathione lyase family enzyme